MERVTQEDELHDTGVGDDANSYDNVFFVTSFNQYLVMIVMMLMVYVQVLKILMMLFIVSLNQYLVKMVMMIMMVLKQILMMCLNRYLAMTVMMIMKLQWTKMMILMMKD